MAKLKKKEIDKINKESFEQLIEEIKTDYNNVKDIYYNDHRGMWTIAYKNKLSDDEFETFSDLCDFLLTESSSE